MRAHHVTFACILVLLSGCAEKPELRASPAEEPAEELAALSMTVEVIDGKQVVFTIRNGSGDPVILAKRQPELIAYVLRDGKEIPITWDASNANMMNLDLLGCVLLEPGDTLNRTVPIWTNYRFDGGFRPNDRIVGVTPALSIAMFSDSERKILARNKQFILSKELRSVPISPLRNGN
jgi:hypothetical protein